MVQNVIKIYDDRVTSARGRFTVTIKPTEQRDHAGCIKRAHELMRLSGLSEHEYVVHDARTTRSWYDLT